MLLGMTVDQSQQMGPFPLDNGDGKCRHIENTLYLSMDAFKHCVVHLGPLCHAVGHWASSLSTHGPWITHVCNVRCIRRRFAQLTRWPLFGSGLQINNQQSTETHLWGHTWHRARGTTSPNCLLQDRVGPVTSHVDPAYDSVPSHIQECSRSMNPISHSHHMSQVPSAPSKSSKL